jgi:leader peptidase (prepilin peptidase)/N-methyltransferase
MIYDIIVLIYGLIIGSFLNVLIYRLPLEQSFLKPVRSVCPKCNYQIKWYENIPLLSYIFLKAKCSKCDTKISIVYPIVELITAVVTFLIVEKLSLNIDTFVVLILFYTLIILSFIDFKYKAVPDYLLLIALILSFFIDGFSFEYALLFTGGFVLLNFILTFYIQNIKSRLTSNEQLRDQTALGEGDIPIIAIIGGLLGLKLSILAFFLSASIALIPSIYNIIKKNDIQTPFIPFLTLGLFIAYIYSPKILQILGISI